MKIPQGNSSKQEENGGIYLVIIVLSTLLTILLLAFILFCVCSLKKEHSSSQDKLKIETSVNPTLDSRGKVNPESSFENACYGKEDNEEMYLDLNDNKSLPSSSPAVGYSTNETRIYEIPRGDNQNIYAGIQGDVTQDVYQQLQE